MFKLSNSNSSYRIPFVVSVSLHLVLVLFLVLSPESKQYRAPSAGVEHPIVQAVALKQASLDEAVHQLDQIKHAKQRAEARTLKRLSMKNRQEARALKRLNMNKKKAAHRLFLQRAEQKRLRLQTVKSKQLLKKTTAKLVKEKAAQQRLAKRRADQKKALAKKQAELQHDLMQSQLVGEKKNLHIAHSHGAFDAYRARIISQIEQHWVIPPGDANSKASCQLLVHLAAGGKVTSVRVLRSTGRAALDRSAKVAVMRASPLPVPKDPALFSSFKTLRLTLKPEALRHT